jgi:hypothetical protein
LRNLAKQPVTFADVYLVLFLSISYIRIVCVIFHPKLLIQDYVDKTLYLASNERVNVNDELERMWKEAVVAYFEIPHNTA